MAYFPSLSITQNVVTDADNSNDNASQIVAGATWNSAGAGTSTLGVVGIQVSVKTDQNLEIYVDQSPDGTNWDITDTIKYWHALGGDGWTIQAVNAHVRVRAKNVGTADTTYIRLLTALCPFVEAVPRTLDEDGHFKTVVHGILGNLGTESHVSPQGNLRTTHSTRLAGANFFGTTLDTNFWNTTGSTGTGGVTQTGGQAIVANGATANSIAKLNSTRTGRYVAGCANYCRIQASMNTGGGTNVRRIGMYDDNDGFFFQYDNSTFSLVCRKGGSDTNTISSGSFNGPHGNVYAIAPDTAYTCEIYVTNKTAHFMIDDVLLHTFTGTVTPLVATLNLPLRAESINSGGNTTNNIVYVRAASLNRLGLLATESIYKNVVGATGGGGTVLKYGAGRLHRLIIGSVPASGQSIVFYDNTASSGTIIGTITISNSSTTPSIIEYDCPFFTGLTIVTVGAALNITVIYE